MSSGKVLILPLAFLILTSFHPGNSAEFRKRGVGEPLDRILQVYQKADKLFRLAAPGTDSAALAGFMQVIAELKGHPDLPGRDTLLFQSYLKKGVLLDVKNDFTGAREAYLTALRLHWSPQGMNGGNKQNDSLSFVIQVYAGSCYYNLNNFDSASYFLLRAEALVGKVHDPDAEVRLYNTLG